MLFNAVANLVREHARSMQHTVLQAAAAAAHTKHTHTHTHTAAYEALIYVISSSSST